MTTTAEYALMAANAYGISREVRSSENTVPDPAHWAVADFRDLPTGFLARAYQGPSGEIVISYGGTTYEDGFPWADWTQGNIPGASGLVNAAPQIIEAAFLCGGQ